MQVAAHWTNAVNFLNGCRAFGVPEDQLFDPDDLVSEKNPLRVMKTIVALCAIVYSMAQSAETQQQQQQQPPEQPPQEQQQQPDDAVPPPPPPAEDEQAYVTSEPPASQPPEPQPPQPYAPESDLSGYGGTAP